MPGLDVLGVAIDQPYLSSGESRHRLKPSVAWIEPSGAPVAVPDGRRTLGRLQFLLQLLPLLRLVDVEQRHMREPTLPRLYPVQSHVVDDILAHGEQVGGLGDVHAEGAKVGVPGFYRFEQNWDFFETIWEDGGERGESGRGECCEGDVGSEVRV